MLSLILPVFILYANPIFNDISARSDVTLNYECYSPGQVSEDYIFVWIDSDLGDESVYVVGSVDQIDVNITLSDVGFGLQGISTAPGCFDSDEIELELLSQ